MYIYIHRKKKYVEDPDMLSIDQIKKTKQKIVMIRKGTKS